MSRKKIKLFKPYVNFYAILNVIKTLRSGQLAEGPRVKEFEKLFSEKFQLENVCALNSGTTALELAYELADIQEGDEVITPILTCTATNLPLIRRKATIVFADIDKDLNISIEDVKAKITTKTKAIIFVHFGGNNRGLKELLEIAKEKNIKLIEDAAQVIGSNFWGKADFTCVSLQAIKTLTSGDGGMLIVKDTNLFNKAKRLRWFGYDRDLKQKQGDTDLLEAGYKYHMNDITAAIGLGNMKSIDKLINHRRSLINEYERNGIEAHIWFATYFSDKREELMNFLKENGVETGIYHYRNDKYTVFGGRKNFKNMDELENKYMILPLHHDVSVDDVTTICNLIKTFENK
ncbi:aminotransferase class V-fold PLP-dependent enzyme [Candidatus Gracilibacteria bacterium]|nr:aminotransferase class V-fold PLP-dependent enzyme [Candidatus Gracilibacteria bacterium]